MSEPGLADEHVLAQLSVTVPTAEDMQRLGQRLAGVLAAGDVIIASGDLGAGKTTFTQGLAEGMQVEGRVLSPTFVISRIHHAAGDGPDLVHVDAYRLGGLDEIEDIDLEATLDSSVTVVEWGAQLAEWLTEHRLEIDIRRSDDPADETREVTLAPVGARWAGVDLGRVIAG